MVNNWRSKVDPTLKKYLETLVYESSKQKDAYKLAPRPEVGQLWCAMADLSKQIVNLNLKIKYLEGALADVAKRRGSVSKTVKKSSSKLKRALNKY